jgi:hypothetical protein
LFPAWLFLAKSQIGKLSLSGYRLSSKVIGHKVDELFDGGDVQVLGSHGENERVG